MQLLIVLAFVTAISVSESAPHEPVPDGAVRIAVAFAMMAVAPLFAVAASTFIAGSLRRDTHRRSELLRWFGYLRNIHALIWFVIVGVVLYQVGWVQLVRFNWNLDGLFLLDDLIVMLPVVLPLLLSWIAFYEVDHGVASEHNGAATCPLVTRPQYVAMHARLYLALLFVPVMAVLATQDLLAVLGPRLPEDQQAWILLAPIGGLLVFFPLILRVIWQCEPLVDGELRARLLNFSRAAGFEPGNLFVWKTGRTIVNAAVAGTVRPWRYVFFTDTLLSRFDDEEVLAVLGHEIGHVRRHHLFCRMMLLALPVAVWFALARSFAESFSSFSNWITGIGVSAGAQSEVLLPITLAIVAAILIAIHSRWLEFDADLYAAHACDLAGVGDLTGCWQMAKVLDKLATEGGIGRKSRSWMHPTIADRIEFLLQVDENPLLGSRFESRLRWFHRSMALLLIVAVACLMVASAGPS